jgi:hypothetical protein
VLRWNDEETLKMKQLNSHLQMDGLIDSEKLLGLATVPSAGNLKAYRNRK